MQTLADHDLAAALAALVTAADSLADAMGQAEDRLDGVLGPIRARIEDAALDAGVEVMRRRGPMAADLVRAALAERAD